MLFFELQSNFPLDQLAGKLRSDRTLSCLQIPQGWARRYRSTLATWCYRLARLGHHRNRPRRFWDYLHRITGVNSQQSPVLPSLILFALRRYSTLFSESLTLKPTEIVFVGAWLDRLEIVLIIWDLTIVTIMWLLMDWKLCTVACTQKLFLLKDKNNTYQVRSKFLDNFSCCKLNRRKSYSTIHLVSF